MGKIVERKRKKKGRPSLLDLQKRNLKEQQQQQPPQKCNLNVLNSNHSVPHSPHNYKFATPTTLRRSARRNPAFTASSPNILQHQHGDDDDDEEAESNGKRREKKLKLVLKLPCSQEPEPNSSSFNSNGAELDTGNNNNIASNSKKKKINAIGDGSVTHGMVKREKPICVPNPTDNVQDSGPSTPLPDRKLLLFIIDRLQKRDTYGAFSEPVDPEELPDYHEVIERPMDFSTIRKTLSSGAYANLEQFEKDVFLICSNAMQYNSPDTIYFRQARAIQELAKKNFENLRQESDDNEPEPKVVRRGRPPAKNFKKPLRRPSLDRTGSEFSSDTTRVTVGQSTIWSNNEVRKGTYLSDKSSFVNSVGRFHGSRYDAYWLAENKSERNDEAAGSMFKGNSMKYGKKQFALDDNRRSTYRQFHPLAGGREPSVLATFNAEKQQLMAVGLLSEHGYARSLAQFAGNIGPVAWKIASQRIGRSLPSGVRFGHGWVGENDTPPQRPLLLSSPLPSLPSPSHPYCLPENSSVLATHCIVESKEEKLSEKPDEDNLSRMQVASASEGHLSNPIPSSGSMSRSLLASKSKPSTGKAETVEELNARNMLNSGTGMIRPRHPLQNQSHVGLNGINGTYRFNLPAHMEKLVGSVRPAGVNIQASEMVETVCRNIVHGATANDMIPENLQLLEHSSTIHSGDALPNSMSETMEAIMSGLQSRPPRHGLSPQPKPDSLSRQQKADSVPPDLNVGFKSPSSSSGHIDVVQPDLALQL